MNKKITPWLDLLRTFLTCLQTNHLWAENSIKKIIKFNILAALNYNIYSKNTSFDFHMELYKYYGME